MARKPKSALKRMLETATKYEDAVRAHSIMHRAVDEDRNVQAGKVYELAQSFREQIRDLDPYVDALIAQNHAFRTLVAGLGPVLTAAAEADPGVAEQVRALEALLGEEGFDAEDPEEAPEPDTPARLPDPPAQIKLDL
jgi:hypothetical protein